MPRISCYIAESTLDKIKKLQCEDEFYKSQPQSQFLKKIIENGLSNLIKNPSELTDALARVNQKLTAYSLKHTTLCAEILSCVIDENKITNNKQMIKARIAEIKQRVDVYMDELFTENVD